MEGREVLFLLALGDMSSSAWGVEKPGRVKAPPALLNWKTVNEKMPWNIVFLLGGGFALAKGSEVRDTAPFPDCLRQTLWQERGRPNPHVGDPW